MNQNEVNEPELVVSRGDWESFLTSLERFISLHQKTIQRLRDLSTRNLAIRTELRSALALPTLQVRPRTNGSSGEVLLQVQMCRYCANEIASSARFCDRCGKANADMICGCGNTLKAQDRFCDTCGRPVILS